MRSCSMMRRRSGPWLNPSGSPTLHQPRYMVSTPGLKKEDNRGMLLPLSLGFALSIQPALRAAGLMLQEHGGKACAISDDMHFVGPIARILEAASVLKERLSTELRCEVQPSKSLAWGRDMQVLKVALLRQNNLGFHIGSLSGALNPSEQLAQQGRSQR